MSSPRNHIFEITEVHNNPPRGGACLECDAADPLKAIILYPSLGTPLVLAPNQKKCCIYIAAETRAHTQFGVGTARDVSPVAGIVYAPSAYPLIDRHLRLMAMNKAKPANVDTYTGELCGDGDSDRYHKAYDAIHVWQVAKFEADALIRDRFGRPFATVSPQAVQSYGELKGGSVYAVEIDLDNIAQKITSSEFLSFAWMVTAITKTTTKKTEQDPAFSLKKDESYHYQDRLIARFLEQQRARHQHIKQKREYHVDYCGKQVQQLVPQCGEGSFDLAAWHPVIRAASAAPLNLGQLTDVHINVRHNALARSDAKVIEGEEAAGKPGLGVRVGDQVCNSFMALKNLFDQMGQNKKPDTAVLLTGDLIDFNRNIVPDNVGKTIGEQWKNFNVLNKVNDADLYQRGQDDMLAFSLVRYAYNTLKLPVFMTSGNHEAYEVPYGISPRIGEWGAAMGILEAEGALRDTQYGRDRSLNLSRLAGRSGALAVQAKVVNTAKDLSINNVTDQYRDFDSASAWNKNKANEGIAADHNMTIYEATLAYGPSYGQALTAQNYQVAHYDWFSTLFTPLSNVVIAFGAEADAVGSKPNQILVALEWGQGENYTNLAGVTKQGIDRQGAGILPRASTSFSDVQFTLLTQAQSYKRIANNAPLVVATHFTIINYGEAAFSDRLSFFPNNTSSGIGEAGFSEVNTGTCERGLATYFAQCVQGETSGQANTPSAPMVDWHFSGHSHRSGVYTVSKQQRSVALPGSHVSIKSIDRITVSNAQDPGMVEALTVKPRTKTHFIVSSCGGPIGVQNLHGELSGWTLRPPSGTLLNPVSGNIRQIKSMRHNRYEQNEKPRLCVVLDYLAIMSCDPDKNMHTPISWSDPSNFSLFGASKGNKWPDYFYMVLSAQLARLHCIQQINLWVFEEGAINLPNGTSKQTKTWHRLTASITRAEKPFMLSKDQPGGAVFKFSLSPADRATLAQAVAASGTGWAAQAFCEVVLQKPDTAVSDEKLSSWAADWAADMHIDDPWVFPIEIGLQQSSLDEKRAGRFEFVLRRRLGEKGEVPDWDWLAATYPEKGYISKEDAIDLPKKKAGK